MRTIHRVTSLICATLLALAAPFARAQIVTDNFNDGNDTGWDRINPLGNAVYGFPGGTAYSIQAPITPSPVMGPARAGAFLTGTTLGDFRITVDLIDWDNSSSTHQAIGLFARAQQPGLGTTDGYFFHYDPFGTSGGSGIWIDRITNEAPVNGAVVGITALNPTLDYRLEFSGVGELLTGRIYAFADLSKPLHEVTFTDSTFLAGSVGLLVADQGALSTGNQSALATFDNFTATAIPEPSTCAAALAAVALGVATCHRRKRQMTAARN